MRFTLLTWLLLKLHTYACTHYGNHAVIAREGLEPYIFTGLHDTDAIALTNGFRSTQQFRTTANINQNEGEPSWP